MASLPLVRQDALPKYVPTGDSGCDESPSCTTCPLPVCKFELPVRRPRRAEKRDLVASLLRDGLSVDEVMNRTQVSRRWVFAVQKAMKEGALSR